MIPTLIDGRFVLADIHCKNGIIADIVRYDESICIEECDEKIVPGFIDIHTHGAVGFDFNHASSDDVLKAAQFFASQGVTSFLPTILTDEIDVMKKQLSIIAEARIEKNCTQIQGIHCEGPFLAKEYKGAMPELFLKNPDEALFSDLQKSAHNLISIITLSPELEGAAELTRILTEQGVRVSVGHSGASYEQTIRCIEAGACSATHTMNAMKLLHMHDPAILTAVLEEDIFCEVICDGFHLHPPIVRLLLKIKGYEKIVLVTDSIMAAGCSDGEYMLGVNKVTVKGGDAKLTSTGVRAGSTLTMIQALRNVTAFSRGRVPLEKIVQMVSENPARMIGAFDLVGSLAVGKKANYVVLNKTNEVIKTIIQGVLVYEK